MRIWKWFRLSDPVQMVGRKRPGLQRPSAKRALRSGAGPRPNCSRLGIFRSARSCPVPHFDHIPVMVAEVLAALRPKPDGQYVDGTVGWGGHAAAILGAGGPGGGLFGCDRDGAAFRRAGAGLKDYEDGGEFARGNLG